jgi:hypothetical protein
MHFYEVRLCKDHRGVDAISDVLPFDRLWYGERSATSNAIGYAKFYNWQRGQVKVHNAILPLRKDKRLFLMAP